MKTVNLGCGNKEYPGAVGVDISDRYNPDVVHDLKLSHIHSNQVRLICVF